MRAVSMLLSLLSLLSLLCCSLLSSTSTNMKWMSHSMSRQLERMVAASRRADIGAARWRRRKGRCPRPFSATFERGQDASQTRGSFAPSGCGAAASLVLGCHAGRGSDSLARRNDARTLVPLRYLRCS